MITTEGLVLAFITAFAFASFGILGRVLSVDSRSPLALAILYQLYGIVFAVPVILVTPWEFGTITITVLLVTFIATVCFGIYEATEFFARRHLEASRFTIFFQITPIVTFAGAIFFLQESFTLTKLLAVGLILCGNLIAVYKHGGAITKKGLLLGLIAVVALGLAYVADKAVFTAYPIGLYIVITYFFPALYVFILFLLRREPVSNLLFELKRGSWKLPLLAAISAGGYFALLSTFRITEASVATPIIYSSTILTVLGGIILLKERGNVLQKLGGLLFVFIGVLLLQS